MIRDVMEAAPWPAILREPWAAGGRVIGRATVIGRALQGPGFRATALFRVRMEDGRVTLVAPDMVFSAANVATRRIAPAPLCIPAVPVAAVRSC